MTSHESFGFRSSADEVTSGIDLTGKTILVTGCNSGIGFETVKALSKRGARIIAMSRVVDAARETCEAIGSNHIPVECDLANFKSIHNAIDKVRSAGLPLDVIITNAGIAAPTALQVRYGVELQFLVNYLAHFLLITRLLDLVPHTTGRIVIGSSSSSARQAPKEGVMFDNLDGHRFYSPFDFYGQSKFATALFAKELARRVASRGICANSVHPGATRGTNLNNGLPAHMKAILKVAQLFMKTPAQGAATQCFLAASPRADRISGEYWADCRIAKGNPLLEDAGLAKKLWDTSERIVASIGE